MKKTIALLTAGAACLLFACGGKQKRAESERIPEYVLTYAENQPEDYPTTCLLYTSVASAAREKHWQ